MNRVGKKGEDAGDRDRGVGPGAQRFLRRSERRFGIECSRLVAFLGGDVERAAQVGERESSAKQPPRARGMETDHRHDRRRGEHAQLDQVDQIYTAAIIDEL